MNPPEERNPQTRFKAVEKRRNEQWPTPGCSSELDLMYERKGSPHQRFLCLWPKQSERGLFSQWKKESPGLNWLRGRRWSLLIQTWCWAAPHRQSRFKTEETAQCQQQRHRWFNGWGAHTSQTRSWSNTPPSAARGRPAVLLGVAGGDYQLEGNWHQLGLISYQGNQQRGMPCIAPLVRTIHQLGPGAIGR